MRKRQHNLDLLDRQILVAMTEDPLASYSKVKDVVGTSVGTVYLRTQRLREMGVIRGAQLLLDPTKLGYSLFATLRMQVLDVDKAVKALAQRPEVSTAYVLTGEQNLLVQVYLQDVSALHEFLQFCTKTLGAARVETQLVMDTPINRAVPIPPETAGWAPKRRSRGGRGGGSKISSEKPSSGKGRRK